jgi:hypothetical protein
VSEDGYSISGSLDEIAISSLYAACQSLRFSGRLQLSDENASAEVEFLGGDPVDIVGGDTQRIALFLHGSFRLTQAIPNLGGALTGGQQLYGALNAAKPAALWAWAKDHRLSCDMRLSNPPHEALVSFQHGHAESAIVNGQPELASLARVASWNDGQWSVRLRPLFTEGLDAALTPPPDGRPPEDPRGFDVSKSIKVPLAKKSDVEPRGTRAWAWVLLGALVAIAGVAVTLWVLKLPPFVQKVVDKPVEPKPVEQKPVETKPVEQKPVETKPVEQKPVEQKPAEQKSAPDPARADKLIAKGRSLLVEGHEHTALDVLKKADALKPGDAAIAIYLQQARGTLGRCELALEGKSPVTIDGHKFTPPRKLKLAAGPHDVDLGDGPQAMTFKRGEKRHLKAKH